MISIIIFGERKSYGTNGGPIAYHYENIFFIYFKLLLVATGDLPSQIVVILLS